MADERSLVLTQQAAVSFRKQWQVQVQVTNSPSNQDATVFVRMEDWMNGIVKK